jgi:hypothetical protein
MKRLVCGLSLALAVATVGIDADRGGRYHVERSGFDPYEATIAQMQ